MNLIVNQQLDRTQKQLIYELTLKKRQSKKTTMSEKQVAARQQLAMELMQERRVPILEHSMSSSCLSCSRNPIVVKRMTRERSFPLDTHSLDETATSINGSVATSGDGFQTAGSPCSSHGGCSFTRSDSSFSASSQDSCSGICVVAGARGGCRIPTVTSGITTGDNNTQMIDPDHALEQLQQRRLLLEAERKREANIRLQRTRLEHLNDELQVRLKQYEHSMAQEKALLGSYNMMLFANEGVNNFHSTGVAKTS